MTSEKNHLKSIILALVVLFIYLGSSYVLGYAFSEAFNSSNYIINTISLILGNLFILLVIMLFFGPKLVNDWYTLKKDDLKIAYKNWVFGLIIMYMSNFIILFFTKDLATNETANRAILDQAPIYAILAMVLIAPITEELVFRLSLKNIFKHKYVYCVVSGLLFGLMHLTTATTLLEFLFIIPYGSLGFFFAKTLYETDNIYSPIITHITHNALVIFIIILGSFVGI